jgi:hypothetical protein
MEKFDVRAQDFMSCSAYCSSSANVARAVPSPSKTAQSPALRWTVSSHHASAREIACEDFFIFILVNAAEIPTFANPTLFKK